MGRAIVRSPQAFLMDEPLSNLDAKLRVQMCTTVSRIQSQLGTTTVYVTHDQTDAMTLGDRVAVMRGGVIQQVGTPEELYERPANLFVAGFIGSPAMNLLPVHLDDNRLRTPMGDLPLPAEVRAKLQQAGAGRDLIMGIRPEHLKDAALVGAEEQPNGLIFSMVVDVLEWLGSEELAYFRVQGARASARELEKLAADAGSTDVPQSGDQLVARLDPASAPARARSWSCGSTRTRRSCSTRRTAPTSPLSDPPTPVELAGGRKHADSLAPRVAHGIGKTAGTLREDRNG